jgi:uncharacterized protein (DUF1800 family)
MRAGVRGTFRDLTTNLTKDPAMLVWLDGFGSSKEAPNENYARELMELFTLGADRGAYTEPDVKEAARALTGWYADYREGGNAAIIFDPERWDPDNKTVFGKTGKWNWQDTINLCIDHPLHPSFFVRKLWSYFIPTPPDAATQTGLEKKYRATDTAILPLVESILSHPDFYEGAPMVKPPVVHQAGLLRARGAGITNIYWFYYGDTAGQRLFYPPDVSGWNDNRWLDSSTYRGRWYTVFNYLQDVRIEDDADYSEETAERAVQRAYEFWGNPATSEASVQALVQFAREAIPSTANQYEQRVGRIWRQNALRQLIAVSPDLQVC